MRPKTRIMFAGLASLLAVSGAINVVLYAEIRALNSEEELSSEVDDRLGIRVRTHTRSVLLAGDKPVTIHDIARDFCHGILAPRVVVFKGLNQNPSRSEAAKDIHEIRWIGQLPDTFQLDLTAGDEVRVENERPPLDGDRTERDSDFLGGGTGDIGFPFCGFGPLMVGWEVYHDRRRWPGNYSSARDCVIRVTESERIQVMELLERLTNKGTSDSVGLGKLTEPFAHQTWTWPAGSTSFWIRCGEQSGRVYLSENSEFIFYTYEHDD